MNVPIPLLTAVIEALIKEYGIRRLGPDFECLFPNLQTIVTEYQQLPIVKPKKRKARKATT
jgi:hypothetical protein